MNDETVGRVLEELHYYTPEAPITSADLGRKLKYTGNKESLRRSGRKAFRAARLAYPDKCGSNEHGYYLIRTREDRLAAKKFLCNHALSEWATAFKKLQPRQERLAV